MEEQKRRRERKISGILVEQKLDFISDLYLVCDVCETG